MKMSKFRKKFTNKSCKKNRYFNIFEPTCDNTIEG